MPAQLLNVLLLFLYAGCSATAVTLLKFAMSRVPFSEPKEWALLISGGLLYAVSFSLWLLILRAWPLAAAFAAGTAITLVLVTIIGWAVFGERPSVVSVSGSVLVVAGVALLGLHASAGPGPGA